MLAVCWFRDFRLAGSVVDISNTQWSNLKSRNTELPPPTHNHGVSVRELAGDGLWDVAAGSAPASGQKASRSIRLHLWSYRSIEVYEIKLRRVGFQRRDDWQTLKSSGGGQLLNWGPHIIDHGLRLLGAPLASQFSDLKLTAALGDAEDHLKIILTGENGRVVDIEISGGAAIGEPEYLVWGTRGALSCSGNTIKMKYLDPNVPLQQRGPDPATPGTTFGTKEELKWVEEEISASPKLAVNMSTIWDELYKTYREGAAFPITAEECLGVMKVVSAAKEGTAF